MLYFFFAMNAVNGLGKTEKLKSRKEIDLIFSGRKSFAYSCIRVFYSVQNEEAEIVKAGFGCSKKIFKKAVCRNRAKRLMREAYRTQKHSLAEAIILQKKSLQIFFLFNKNELTDYENVRQTIFVILQKLEKIVTNQINS